MAFVEVHPVMCPYCDLGGSGQRGTDRCSRCDGTGSIYRVGRVLFPNTQKGYQAAVYAANYDVEKSA